MQRRPCTRRILPGWSGRPTADRRPAAAAPGSCSTATSPPGLASACGLGPSGGCQPPTGKLRPLWSNLILSLPKLRAMARTTRTRRLRIWECTRRADQAGEPLSAVCCTSSSDGPILTVQCPQHRQPGIRDDRVSLRRRLVLILVLLFVIVLLVPLVVVVFVLLLLLLLLLLIFLSLHFLVVSSSWPSSVLCSSCCLSGLSTS